MTALKQKTSIGFDRLKVSGRAAVLIDGFFMPAIRVRSVMVRKRWEAFGLAGFPEYQSVNPPFYASPN